ncbi:MdtA/MuxA family multidrug efflux RND transporter periplasmic adaptor subunit [Thorsellia anophelis]|uniref:Membrane fusion protein, multidrug efflux system n=1 Tax=Thorsellia anophelis DSM 18579 TaxID=1123402 RepID=A0A1H9YAD4_9GAMM|nr:MdtA/MuxA family multidrug efflux RND transporter periplasmic adaptor subunit [Thorsellia anophelis]SES65805.1 membrane fusion protein, multidrug efflux system [Thorsellia anophelis DSM 18579]
MALSTNHLEPRKSKLKKYFLIIGLFVSIAIAAIWFYNRAANSDAKTSADTPKTSSARGARGGANQPLPPVKVVPVTLQDIANQLNSLGTVQAKETVTITSRVSGELIQVHFKEGQYVKEGDLLFSIDPRSFEIALEQAKGQLLKDQANLDNAKADVARFNQLKLQSAVSQQELATQKALVKQLEGVVASSQAQVDNAELQLSYTQILAPISGNSGLEQISVGNYVQASTQPLLTLTQTNPIDILFSLPERYVQEIRKAFNHNEITLEAWNSDLSEQLAQGKVISFDNQIDRTTGTLQIKAEFPNSENLLFPNQFVNLVIKLNTQKDALALPVSAIQTGAQGEFVWRVIPAASDSSSPESNEHSAPAWQVEKVNIRTGIRHNNLVAIEDGLALNDTIVTDGVDRLTQGAKVQMINQPMVSDN